jgi:hypothetical protein
LRDFVFHGPRFPALKRWAIFTAFPFGTHVVMQSDSRLDAASEAVKWQELMRKTQAFVAARGITDGDIADEVAAVRAGR